MKKEKKEYQRPSIKVIEAEVQQPIATSAVGWSPDPTGDGTITDN